MSAGWFVAAGLALVLARFGFRRLLARAGAEIRATGYTPLAELFGGQVGDDTLAMVADDKPKVMRSHGFTETSPGVWEATFEADHVDLDPMVESIVAKVHEAIAACEAVELHECEQEFLADPMNFGRAES